MGSPPFHSTVSGIMMPLLPSATECNEAAAKRRRFEARTPT